MLDETLVRDTLGAALLTGGEFAEIFVEDRRSSSAVLDDGKIEELVSGHDRGAGIRVVSGETTGFAHTADLSASGPEGRSRRRPRRRPAAAAAAPRSWRMVPRSAPRPNEVLILPADVAKATKVELLTRADQAARSAGSSITQVAARYMDSRRRILVANSDGVWADDDQVKTLFSVSCVALGDTGMQTGRESVGRTVGFELFDMYDVEELARHAAQRAITKLERPPRTLGRDAGRHRPRRRRRHVPRGVRSRPRSRPRRASRRRCYARQARREGRERARHAHRRRHHAHEWGCYAIDDEGNPAQRNVLIENGVLTDYMWDFLRSRKEGRASSGNGRRQSYTHLPMVRMTNTYIARTAPTIRRRSSPAPTAASTSRSSAAVRSTPPPATSCSA